MSNLHKGLAPIKSEYLLTDVIKKANVDYLTKEDKERLAADAGGDNGNVQDGPPKKKFRGQNKSRRSEMAKGNRQQRPSRGICHKFIAGGLREGIGCEQGDECRFSHDIKPYLDELAEISPMKPKFDQECYLYAKYGFCRLGVLCRYSNCHINEEDLTNKIDESKWNEWKDKFAQQTKNAPAFSLLISTQKKQYNFSEADEIIKQYAKRNQENEEEKVDPVPEREKKPIDFRGKLYLAPLTTVGNLPFRRICKEFGADITCGEMAMAHQILQGHKGEWALLRRHESEDVFGVQLCGSYADQLARTCQLIRDNCDVDFVDLNMGCPIDLVYKKGAGSGLMSRSGRLNNIIDSMYLALGDIPLTIKMRTGVMRDKNIATKLIEQLKLRGAHRVALYTVHGRSREARYTRQADWSYIEECARVAPKPLFGSGDILSYEDLEAHLQSQSSVSGGMIARGALIKPWIFTEIKERRHWDISSSERFEILKRFTNYGLEHWGSDDKGVENTRRFLLEWLSFLHRYIPIGLLEVLPQRINDRPSPYKGRDDLETLMASSCCDDWIKISEMLLGPAPDSFVFLPKHKANAFSYTESDEATKHNIVQLAA